MVDRSNIPDFGNDPSNSEIFALWHRYRLWIIGFFLVVVAGVAINEYWQSHRKTQALAFFAALENRDFADISGDAPGLVLLAQANQLVELGELENASALYADLSARMDVDAVIRERARLGLIALGHSAPGEAGSYSDVAEWIAIDQMIGAGDEVGARAALGALLAREGAVRPPWAETLMLALGGELPEANNAILAEPDVAATSQTNP